MPSKSSAASLNNLTASNSSLEVNALPTLLDTALKKDLTGKCVIVTIPAVAPAIIPESLKNSFFV